MDAVLTHEDYELAFQQERAREYPLMDQIEERCGFRLDRAKLENAARVLACPVKVNPPNWQHGRLIYALVRRLSQGHAPGTIMQCLDIGTAKGFSALCAQWAIEDENRPGVVRSCDVIDPRERVRRNTVAELAGLRTLRETLQPWPEAQAIEFIHSPGVAWLSRTATRQVFVFVDGKHTADTVLMEGTMIAKRQRSGDMILFDDVQLPGVAAAVEQVARMYHYDAEYIELLPNRAYVWAVRR